MDEGPPRRHIDELVTRWTLTKLRLLVVEGPSDQRLLRLVQREAHCHEALRDLDVWPVEAIEVLPALLQRHGLVGIGAKQRVVACVREIESLAESEGFRGVVDKDLDQFLDVDLRSPSVLYTDHGCLDAYLWTIEVLRRLIIQFKAEDTVRSAGEIHGLFTSIGSSCADLAAFRIASALHPQWTMTLHRSEKALSIRQKRLYVDLARYVEQGKPVRGTLNDAKACVKDLRSRIEAIEPLDLLNIHDLVWLLTFTLKAFTKVSRRLVDEETVGSSLAAFGVMDNQLTDRPMFKALANWAKREAV